MFTGLIEAIGSVRQCTPLGGDFQLSLATPASFTADLSVGDSIAVNGVCLTVTRFGKGEFSADMSIETIQHTTVKNWCNGVSVNLERALTLTTRLGGHIVTGHVDGVGTVIDKMNDGRSWRFTIATPCDLHPYLAPKGSLTVDGVSLTLNACKRGMVSLNIVPHTLQATTLQSLAIGSEVNIEVDILARYAEHLLLFRNGDAGESATKSGLSKQVLAEYGFIK